MAHTKTTGLHLENELSSPDSRLSIAVGYALGTRRLDGGYQGSYFGRRCMASGQTLLGSFARPGRGFNDPGLIDNLWLDELRDVSEHYLYVAKSAGLDGRNPLLAAGFFDFFTRYADVDMNIPARLFSRFPELARAGLDPMNMVYARIEAFYGVRIPFLKTSLGNDFQTILETQRRIVGQMHEVFLTEVETEWDAHFLGDFPEDTIFVNQEAA